MTTPCPYTPEWYWPEDLDYQLQDAWNKVAPRSLAFLPWYIHATGEPWDTLREFRNEAG